MIRVPLTSAPLLRDGDGKFHLYLVLILAHTQQSNRRKQRKYIAEILFHGFAYRTHYLLTLSILFDRGCGLDDQGCG